MCKYCELHTVEYKDKITGEVIDRQIQVESLKLEEEREACIIFPTPISIRKHREDGLTSTLQIYDGIYLETHEIPIKYCPFCGRELK